MKTICVGGASSNCGKTELTCLLLKAFPGWAAIKVTPCRPDDVCLRGHECGACRAPSSGYEVVTDTDKLAMDGKDTARFLDCGASRVAWVRASQQYLPKSLESAYSVVSGAPGVIVESTTAMRLLSGLHILVVRQTGLEIKESAQRCMKSVDLLVVNLWPTEVEHCFLPISSNTTAPSFAICAALGPEYPANHEFIGECRDRVRNFRD